MSKEISRPDTRAYITQISCASLHPATQGTPTAEQTVKYGNGCRSLIRDQEILETLVDQGLLQKVERENEGEKQRYMLTSEGAGLIGSKYPTYIPPPTSRKLRSIIGKTTRSRIDTKRAVGTAHQPGNRGY